MNSKLVCIGRTHDDEDAYEVILEIDGERQSIRCRVVDHTGIRVVQPTPDLMSTLPFPPRVLVAAVLAFDAARREADNSST